MNLREAIKALYEGKKVALPEWSGYWFVENGAIRVFTKDGEYTDTPWFDKYANREDWKVVEEAKNPRLAKTASMMISPDYKERFRAEYFQTLNRYERLSTMVSLWDANGLDFTPTCPREMYDRQLSAMLKYLHILKDRADLEEVELY